MENRKSDNNSIITPYLINFSKIGNPEWGYISVAENESLPFNIKRIYWTYLTPETVKRGSHAHYNLEQIIIAAAGEIYFEYENREGKKDIFHLSNPSVGLFIPRLCWHQMKYSEGAVQLVLASEQYNESDYIRDYDTFGRIKKQYEVQ